MSADSGPGSAALTLSLEWQVNAACDRFEAAWQAGGRPRLEDYLAGCPEPARAALLAELLPLELVYRGRAGEAPAPEEYHARLPAHAALIDAAFRAREQPTLRRQSQAATREAAARGAEAGPPAVPGYEGLSWLGEGGMGVVWRGRNRRLHRDVAIKVMKAALAHQPQLARRFLEEAQVASQLAHPSIPPVHEFGELPDGRPYFVMKLIKGRTLADLLKERSGLSREPTHFLTIFEQVCQAVGYAHSKGVLHRDLKPRNVMVGAFGEVQVMDWGLAKVLTEAGRERERPEGDSAESVVTTARTADPDDVTQKGTALGTWAYMAPEQARGEVGQLDRRCDVFGLGAILCEVLTGQPPYVGTSKEVEDLAQNGRVEAVRRRLAACGADPELVELAGRCLSPAAEQRPADAAAVAAALTAYLAGVRERLRRAELDRAAAETRVALEHKRRRVQLGLGSALLLLLAVCLVSAWQINRLQTDMTRLHKRNVASLQAAQELEIQLRRLRFYSFVYLLNPVPVNVAQIDDTQEKFERALERAQATAASDEGRALLRQIEDGYHIYRDEMARLRIPARLAGAPVDVRQLADALPLHPVIELCSQLVQVNSEEMVRVTRESESVSDRVSLTMLLLGLGGLAGGLFSMYGIARELSRSLSQRMTRRRRKTGSPASPA
jgi:hypothetical protein